MPRTRQDILGKLSISARRSIDQVVSWVEAEPALFGELLDIALSGDDPYSWRATWALDHLSERWPERFLPEVERIVAFLPNTDSPRKLGTFPRILSRLDSGLDSTGPVLDLCYRMLRRSDLQHYVKVYCLQFIGRMADYEPLLLPEICAHLEDCLPLMNEYQKRKARAIILQGNKQGR
jgi:hypothetical protein